MVSDPTISDPAFLTLLPSASDSREKTSRVLAQQSGALLIDKPSGMTSFDVIRDLKRRFGIKKIGHSGTLDPLATGLLIILIGEGTRLQSIVLSANKRYEGLFRLGIQTATDDLDGEIIARDEVKSYRNRIGDDLCREIQSKFQGKILQRPPVFSAIKKDGKKSYELARKGVALELEEREIEIFALELEFIEPEVLRYRLECSKGTYVRSLGRDIGEFLGTFASVETLRRTHSSGFDIKDAVPLAQLLETRPAELPVIPLERLVDGLPRVVLPDTNIADLLAGRQSILSRTRASSPLLHALWSESGRFSGLLEPVEHAGGPSSLKIRFLRPFSE